ncbi:MAG: serine/threonine protein kinase [Proteobacteria bacterium]|nr:serine/threonine protein kinase [Pseudomonadota bacterium]
MIQPKIFGKFILLERVSVGGMAEVYRAKLLDAPDFERFFAIKRILPHLAADEDFVSMFINEAKLAVELEHPNVCQIYELGRLGDSHYIAMEYIAGRDVKAIQEYYRKKKKIMSVSQACFIIAQAAQGLDYAHRAVDKEGQPMGIVHRDVSPQNLLVTYDGVVKLIDFGVSKAARKTSHSMDGVLKGKYSYMSPEQATNQEIDHRSDIFALGVIFWELLTGRRLFQAEAEIAILEMISECNITPPTKYNKLIPDVVEKICMKALSKDLSKRYKFASEMVVDLIEFISSCKTPFTQWHLQTWMCKAFAKEFEEEWEKIPIFKQLNTVEDVDKYNREHASSYTSESTSKPKAIDNAALSEASLDELEKGTAPLTEDELAKASSGKLAAVPAEVIRVEAPEGGKAIPIVKPRSPKTIDTEGGGARLDISANSLQSEEDVELVPEGVAPTVSDPNYVRMKRIVRRARTRTGLAIFIIVLCICLMASPLIFIFDLIQLPKPELKLPGSAEVTFNIAPTSENSAQTEVFLYRFPRNATDKPSETAKGANVTFSDLQAGSYSVDVIMPGYERETFNIDLENGRSQARLELLRPKPVLTKYSVEISPEDALLFVDGKLVQGTGSPRIIEGTVGNNYTLRSYKPGYQPLLLAGTVEADMKLTMTLEPGSPVLLHVSSSPDHCAVFVYSNGSQIAKGETPFTKEINPQLEDIQVEVSHADYEKWTQTVSIKNLEDPNIKLFADLN